MIHTTNTITRYILGDHAFIATGLTSDYAGAPVDARIEYMTIERGAKQATLVTLEGWKLRKDGHVSRVSYQSRMMVQSPYYAENWTAVWDQMPDLTKLGLTDEDRLNVTPR